MSTHFWDARYSEPEYAYGTEPNVFLASALAELALPPGSRLLFPAEGEGRNAVFAAGLGHEVLAFDQSAAGREKALRLAEARGVRIDYRVADLETFDIPSGAFDAIALTFVHLPPEIRRTFHRRLVEGLAPGGVLILEAFTPEHQALQEVNPHAGGPRDPSLLFMSADLRDDFGGLECLRLEECTVELAEGPHHRGSAAVVRYIGRKPGGG